MDIYVLNENFEAVKMVEVFMSMIWTERYSEAGDFELLTTVDLELMKYAKAGNYLWYRESDRLMIIEGSEIICDVDDGNRLKITGRSLESILDRRIVWPQMNLKGSLQNGVESILNATFISPDDSNRTVPNFIFEESEDDTITSLQIDAQYAGENVYDILCDLCKQMNLGFKIVLNDENKMVFSLYKGEDRSYDQTTNPCVVFSKNYENIISSDYLENDNAIKNVAYVAGEGEGSDRTYEVVGNVSGLKRKELFSDSSDISSTTDDGTLTPEEYSEKLKQRGQEELIKCPKVKAFDCEVETTIMFKYGVDFFLGDVVQVVNEYGIEAKSRVTEMIRSQDDSGYSAYPSFTIIDEQEE